MMNKRNLIVLALVVVALVAISIIQKAAQRQRTSRPATAAVLDHEVDRDALQRLEIARGDSVAVVLTRGPSGWEVASRFHQPANEQRVTTLLDDLSSLRGEFRSDAAGVLADYGLSDSTAVVIRGYGSDPDSAPLFALEVGDRPGGATGDFVRRAGSSAVFLSSKGVLNDLGLYSGPGLPDPKHFLDLEAFKVPRDDVDALRLYQDGKLTLALAKEFPEPAAAEPDTAAGEATMAATDQAVDRRTYEWRLTAPKEAPALKTKADAILGAATTIRAVDVADPDAQPEAYGLEPPERRIVLVMQDGSEKQVLIGSARQESEGRPGGSYLQVAGERPVYVVKQYQLDNIFKQPTDLQPAN